MINLNKLNKKLLSKEEILKHYDDWDIYRYYCNSTDININKAMLSPIREEEKPSFAFFIGESGEICFNDFKIGKGDFIKLVQLKYGLNYYESLSKIAIDLGFDDEYIVKRNINTDYNQGSIQDLKDIRTREAIIKDLNSFSLRKKAREWKASDILFWNKFGITKETLLLYNVEPISHIFIKEKIIPCKDLSYCFTEKKDNIETYKIYQPFNNKYKWLNNHNSTIWQGWSQLPKKGKQLIITKSLKDVMSIKDITGVSAVSLQNEGVLPKESVINELKERFDIIYVLYDNDFDKEYNWGREFGKKLSETFNLKQIEIEDIQKAKDFSDFVKLYGNIRANEYLRHLIKLPF